MEKNPEQIWIFKPPARSQGKDIFLLNGMKELNEVHNKERIQRRKWVASHYIQNPLLIENKKFDLRLYCLVRSFRPLVAYMYDGGFARFCSNDYTTDPTQLSNMHVHLTNVSINKKYQGYNAEEAKWDLHKLYVYLASKYGIQSVLKLRKGIENIMKESLRSVQNVMVQHNCCFELYGFDILIDEKFKPWLIEINASPAIHASSFSDGIFKAKLIDDLLNTIIPDRKNIDEAKSTDGIIRSKNTGNFKILIDEPMEMRGDSKVNGDMSKYGYELGKNEENEENEEEESNRFDHESN